MMLILPKEKVQKDIFVGHEAENPNNVLMICQIPSMEELQEFMQLPENASAIADSGAKLETFKATPLADQRHMALFRNGEQVNKALPDQLLQDLNLFTTS